MNVPWVIDTVSESVNRTLIFGRRQKRVSSSNGYVRPVGPAGESVSSRVSPGAPVKGRLVWASLWVMSGNSPSQRREQPNGAQSLEELFSPGW